MVSHRAGYNHRTVQPADRSRTGLGWRRAGPEIRQKPPWAGRLDWSPSLPSAAVVGVVIHVMAVAGLGGAAMAASVMGYDAIAVLDEEQHLRVPIIGRQRPAVAEHDGLTFSPVLVEDLNAVFCGDRVHVEPLLTVVRVGQIGRNSRSGFISHCPRSKEGWAFYIGVAKRAMTLRWLKGTPERPHRAGRCSMCRSGSQP